MCQAILEGLRDHIEEEGRLVKGICSLYSGNRTDFHTEDQPESSLKLLKLAAARHQLGDIFDATTGQLLKGCLVAKAREKEMEYFESKGVWEKVPKSEAIANTGKQPITVKWVDVNKGDDEEPNCRSRLVAREVRRKGEE